MIYKRDEIASRPRSISAGITPDGKTIVYSYNRVLGDLYSVEGLR